MTRLDRSIAELGDVWNPHAAIRAMAFYHRQLWTAIRSDREEDRWCGVLSSYNGGRGWYNRDRKLAGTSRWFGGIELHNAGRAPQFFRENRDYVSKIFLRWRPLYASKF